ncbi:Tyrosine recombinase XerD [Serratia quinivorans]|uniref:tyrosine-type DNA invertase n=2 Tax=Serratia quinivorans TaxID=137545 RepID=UPI00217958B6|nr:tyrosine-type DNA invertase [Serratia quinivorans]CAI1827441.1 Tyrosine recombinase XerD [Serratia quinivorans]
MIKSQQHRKHLTRGEVGRLLLQAAAGRAPERDTCLIWMGFIHGCRVSELTGLRLADLDMDDGCLYISRLKNGLSTTHPLEATEKRLLQRWLEKRQFCRNLDDQDWLFLSQKGYRLSRQRIFRMLREYGRRAGLEVEAHPHMLRHACGYALADNGADTRVIQDYLGHRNIQHTVLYTAANAGRFRDLWEEKRQKNVTL